MANNITQEPNNLIIIIEETCNIELIVSDTNTIKDIIVTEESKTNVIVEQKQSFEIFPVASPVALQGERGYSGYSGYSGLNGISGYSGITPSFSIVTKTANYTATTVDYTILVDASGGTIDILLPSSPTIGQILNVKKIDDSLNTVTITRAGTQTIDDVTVVTIYTQYNYYTIQFDGTNWYII